MRHYQKIFALLTLLSIFFSAAAQAQTTAFTYQGKLTLQNLSGQENAFFGASADANNTTGSNNAIFGGFTGLNNTGGTFNTIIGSQADVFGTNLTNATAIGANAIVAQSNSLVLGNGVNVGIGTIAPTAKLHVDGLVRVTNGAIFVTNPNTLIITSPNGACWGIRVNNTGGLATFPVGPCP